MPNSKHAEYEKLLKDLEASVKSGQVTLGFALARAMMGGVSLANEEVEKSTENPPPLLTLEQVRKQVDYLKRKAAEGDGELVAVGIQALYRDVLQFCGDPLCKEALECEKIEYSY